MNFFEFNSRQDYASYWPEEFSGEINDLRVPVPFRKVESRINEYLGDPPRKPAKKGVLLKSAYSYFCTANARDLILDASKGGVIFSPTDVVGRESESVHQFWVVNLIDCLDLSKTVASPATSGQKGKLGVIKRPFFDESKWDGSDLFIVPQDPSYCYFVSTRFAEKWQASKFKGAKFSRFLMDPEAIRC